MLMLNVHLDISRIKGVFPLPNLSQICAFQPISRSVQQKCKPKIKVYCLKTSHEMMGL